MPGVNAKTYLELFVSRAFPTIIGAASPANISDTEIFGYLNRALSRVQKSMRMVQVRDSSLTLTNGTQSYFLPALRLGTSIREIMIKNRAGDGHIPLRQRSIQFMRDNYDLDDVSRDVGDPAYWAYSNETSGSTTTGLLFNKKFIIRPVPTWTWANGIIVDFPPTNRQIGRIQNLASGTASAAITFGSPTVTITGTANFLIGDEIGFVYSTQTDGVSTAPLGKETARRWYTIIDKTGGTVTLAEPCAEFSVSGVAFITAEVSPIEMALPDEAAFAPVYLALEEYLMSIEPLRAKSFGDFGRGLLSGAIQEYVNGQVSYPRVNEFSWLWRNGGRGWPYGPLVDQNPIWP